MSWSIGFDSDWNRFIGYGVVAYCDHPGCNETIDRGLSYVCGGAPYGGERGCGLYFCSKHLLFHSSGKVPQLCDRCSERKVAFEPKQEHPKWIKHILTDKSWADWRKDNIDQVNKFKAMLPKKPFHGKVIYNPSGKAGEYSYWAANFYNGCSARCEYCYNRHGRAAKVVGGDVPTLKKSLINEEKALEIFCKELGDNLNEIKKYGLFFNFVSDPFLPDTEVLNFKAMRICIMHNVPVKALTKQIRWIDWFINGDFINKETWAYEPKKHLWSLGFTLTGHDKLEPGAATNQERIEAMKKLHDAGFKTWASIEPIIDIESSWKCIIQTANICDLYKIGLQSGKKYDILKLMEFYLNVLKITKNEFRTIPVYFKDSLLKQAGINRADLPSNCVDRSFNL